MKHKSMSEMNKERQFKKAQKEAQQEETDYKGGKAYYTFLNMFYKNKKENDKSKKTDKEQLRKQI